MMPKLGSDAQDALAVERVFGRPPKRDLDIKWNDMVMNLEERKVANFIEDSRKVQGFIRVLLKDSDVFGAVVVKLGVARYCVAKNPKEWGIASAELDEVRKMLEDNGISISSITAVGPWK